MDIPTPEITDRRKNLTAPLENHNFRRWHNKNMIQDLMTQLILENIMMQKENIVIQKDLYVSVV